MDKTIKLKESIQSDGVKIIELYNKIDNGLLNTRPNYQRKLVWKKQHKYAFIDTILKNYPFPEIYIASSDIDVDRMVATEVVVDGQQRLTTIIDYIKSVGDFENQKKVTSFENLTQDVKKEFLNYKVSVKDLKDIGEDLIKEIFQRINSTEYSLNTVEKNNALFGDGEIAIFSKQLVDINYIATEDTTDIIVENKKKETINNFFIENKVFTENDKKRMYDFQFVMLYIATLLEGNYFGRSTKVDEYLDKYNSSFPDYEFIEDNLLKSIKILTKFNFSYRSYWFNKANLFTLLIEFSKNDLRNINFEKLELELLSLEDKVDIYFTADTEEEIKDISDDEKKYFEVARQGSHEKSAREHRGKVIKNILEKCLKEDKSEDIETTNLTILENNSIPYTILIPTNTGLNKGIMDAISKVRLFLKVEGIHNYDEQKFGPTYKEKLDCIFQKNRDTINSEMSLYRSNGRGDYRIWFKDLKTFAEAGNKLALINVEGKITLLNISTIDYNAFLTSL